MNEIIKKRKSIRKYDMAPLDAAALETVRAQFEKIKPLYPDIRYSIDIVQKVKGMVNVKAPHYLVFGSEEKEGMYENIGFIGQQLDLFFSGAGLGSCWLGMAKPEDKKAQAFPYAISMAFGKPAEPLYRELTEFKRKQLAEISEGADERIEAARLAPSAQNLQNWYFTSEGGKIHCYRIKPNPLLGFIYNRFGCIDMGIALCHIAYESDSFHYIKDENASARKGCEYMGTVQ